MLIRHTIADRIRKDWKQTNDQSQTKQLMEILDRILPEVID